MEPSSSNSSRHLAPEICEICGDRANGYHYEVPSCNGCKTFFRRSTLNNRVYKPCQSNGRCAGTPDLKRCRFCRFNRCMEKGMNALCIVSIRTASSPDQRTEPILPVISVHAIIDPPLQTEESRYNRLLDELLFVELAHQRIRRSKYSPSPADEIPLRGLLHGHSKLSNDYGELDRFPVEPCADKKMMSLEMRIQNRIPYHSPTTRGNCPPHSTKMWPHAELVFTIEYAKTFEFFSTINDDERRLLALSSIVPCTQLTSSFFSFESNSEVTYHPDGSKVAGYWLKNSPNKIEYHHDGIERIREMKMDKREYVLLKAMIICNPDVEGLSTFTRKILASRRERYTDALISYVLARRGNTQGPATFLQFIEFINWLSLVSRRQKEQHLLLCAYGLKPWTEDIGKKRLLLDEINDTV